MLNSNMLKYSYILVKRGMFGDSVSYSYVNSNVGVVNEEMKLGNIINEYSMYSFMSRSSKIFMDIFSHEGTLFLVTNLLEVESSKYDKEDKMLSIKFKNGKGCQIHTDNAYLAETLATRSKLLQALYDDRLYIVFGKDKDVVLFKNFIYLRQSHKSLLIEYAVKDVSGVRTGMCSMDDVFLLIDGKKVEEEYSAFEAIDLIYSLVSFRVNGDYFITNCYNNNIVTNGETFRILSKGVEIELGGIVDLKGKLFGTSVNGYSGIAMIPYVSDSQEVSFNEQGVLC